MNNVIDIGLGYLLMLVFCIGMFIVLTGFLMIVDKLNSIERELENRKLMDDWRRL